MVETGAIRLRLAPKFEGREILVRRFRISGPFGLKIFVAVTTVVVATVAVTTVPTTILTSILITTLLVITPRCGLRIRVRLGHDEA